MFVNFTMAAWYRIRLSRAYAGNFNVVPSSLSNLYAFIIAKPS